MIEPTPNFDNGGEPDSWKNEVASRLDRYRSRNKRKLSGEFSMRFNFEGELAGPRQQICVPNDTEVQESESDEEAAIELAADEQAVEAKEELPAAEPEPPAPPPPLRPSVPFKRKVVMEANVIEFPRLFPPEPPPSYMIAEPVLPSSPRILDAPEIAQPLLETPILDGMRLEHLETEPAPEIELPLQVASVQQRIYASVADCLIVSVASGIFIGIVYKMLPGVDWTKPMIGATLLVPAVLWSIYQYLFLVYGARTPGMMMGHLAFSTFQGTAPNRRERRARFIGTLLSCCSLMLGFLWAFFDEDALCWHDRISRTYCFREKP